MKLVEIKSNTTCAVAIFTRDGRVLVVHPTGSGYLGAWSLPKGLCGKNETCAAAAARETQEETSLDLSGNKLRDHGTFAYLKDKDYRLFSTTVPMIDVKTLRCTSTFERNGQRVIEVDRYQLVDHENVLKLLNKKQAAIYGEVFPAALLA